MSWRLLRRCLDGISNVIYASPANVSVSFFFISSFIFFKITSLCPHISLFHNTQHFIIYSPKFSYVTNSYYRIFILFSAFQSLFSTSNKFKTVPYNFANLPTDSLRSNSLVIIFSIFFDCLTTFTSTTRKIFVTSISPVCPLIAQETTPLS